MTPIVFVDKGTVDHRAVVPALERRGFEVHAAKRGIDALALCRSLDPAVVIADLDAVWDDTDGASIVRQLRDEYPDVPIIVLSESCGPDRRRGALNSGASFCLAKPVDGDALVEMAALATKYSARHAGAVQRVSI